MFRKTKKLVNNLLRLNGFTIVETLIAIGITVIVVLGVVSAATFSLRFSTLEKARTIAQDVSRNVMSQHIRTVEFDSLRNLLGTSQVKRVTLFQNVSGLPKIESLDQTSSLSEDLKKLQNAKCEVVLRQMPQPNQIDVKVRVLWGLNSDGTENKSKTRFVELSTIASRGDLNLKRTEVLAEAIAPERTSGIICEGGCPLGKICNKETGMCETIVCDPDCATGKECINGVCMDKCEPECTGGKTCVAGVCVNTCSIDEHCATGYSCENGVCKPPTLPTLCLNNNPCKDSEACISGRCQPVQCTSYCPVNQACVHGTCETVSCPDYACPAGYKCESSSCVIEATNNCKPKCGKTEICVVSTCVSTCNNPTGRKSGCSCSAHTQCASGTCLDNNKKCD